MVTCVLRYRPNFDAYIACALCQNFLCFLKYVFQREIRNGVIFLYLDPLYVANCTRDGNDFRCICNEIVGVAEQLAIVFNRYIIYEPVDTEDHDGLSNELELFLTPNDNPDLVAGCVRCRRPIGYGANFLTRIVRTIELINVKFMDEATPQDGFFYIEDGLRVECRCGAYIGYMLELERVVLGAIVSLGYRYQQ